MAEYEYLRLSLPRSGDPAADRGAARALLTQHAEYGRWELQRVRLLPDGRRRVVMRRPIIRHARPAPAAALV